MPASRASCAAWPTGWARRPSRDSNRDHRPPDSRPGLAGIACPAIVIAGRDDALMPPEIHDEQAAGIRGADLALLGDCGHLSSIEQPERVNAALAGWLARIPAGAR